MNRIRRFLSLLFFVAISFYGIAQTKTVKDTITIMQYNLLNYGYNGNTCDGFDISLANKDKQLKLILNYIKPDVLAVNEMGCKSVFSRRILINCLNQGTSKYALTNLQVSGTQNLCNSLFYNTDKLGLVSSSKITKTKNGANIIRAIDFHKLYIKGKYLETSDTISYSHLIAHLKASNGASERAQREKAAEGIMYHLEQNETTGNYILSGDFNVYSSTEGAYQQFTKYSKVPFRFNDPVKQEGSWNNNSNYSKVHTQSTHAGRCGGMDDRFDFVLASSQIINDSMSIRYIPGSYFAVGQDGKRFNGSLKSPANTSVPNNVLNALYNMSDHTPVVLKLEVTYQVPTSVRNSETIEKSKIINPSINGIQFTTENSTEKNPMKYQVFSMDGGLILEGIVEIRGGFQKHTIELSNKGMFVLQLTDLKSLQSKSYKVIVW